MDIKNVLTVLKKLKVDQKLNRYSSGKAPHKPILLLSLIILNKNNKVDLNNIKPDIYLRETWKDLWSSLDYDKVGPIHLPMYHLRSDGFWNIEFRSGITPHQPKSLFQLMDMAERISLDKDVIEYLNDQDTSNQIINAILNGGYFSEGELVRLRERISTLFDSFRYQEEIVKRISVPFEMDHSKENVDADHFIKKSVRDPAFRISILEAYDETCSVCGWKLLSSSGISINDAAHILPYSKFFNDDIRNGICLCKNHHWLFDRFLLSFDEDYRVIISKDIETEKPENILSKYDGEKMILPERSERNPHPSAIEWHRMNMRR